MQGITVQGCSLLGMQSKLIDIEIKQVDRKSHKHSLFTFIGISPRLKYALTQRLTIALHILGKDTKLLAFIINFYGNPGTTAAQFETAILAGIIAILHDKPASKKLLKSHLFLGQLSIHGDIKPVVGGLPCAYAAHKANKKKIFVSPDQQREISILPLTAYPMSTVHDIETIVTSGIVPHALKKQKTSFKAQSYTQDFSDVKGQQKAKRALQIAAAGNHHLFFVGPPGVGKSMMANRIRTIMPDFTPEESLETSQVYSIAEQLPKEGIITQRPFRTPHHSSGRSSLVGGGQMGKPGEISLANNGILFLDEFSEIRREAIEALREPLETHEVSFMRNHQSFVFPAKFLLVAAVNPCPCGYFGDPHIKCKCSGIMVKNYNAKLSGPIVDRIDMAVQVHSVDIEDKHSHRTQSSDDLKQGVLKAIKIQEERFGNTLKRNSDMDVKEIGRYCHLSNDLESLMNKIYKEKRLSMRSYHKILKIARTISDLEESASIQLPHLKEAFALRGDV